MAKTKTGKSPPPAITPQGRESQLKAAALDLAEEKIRDGTASSQLITTVLKMCYEKEQLELEQLRKQNALLEAKRSAIDSEDKDRELLKEALEAFRRYSGNDDNEEY